jgi:hypothetical protein
VTPESAAKEACVPFPAGTEETPDEEEPRALVIPRHVA